ncbi:MarR family transcriptional regulator [Selenomonadales bacterium OttesenSCG-928-I06]|nr:MarR family transcriptional regulator [Selenomonadales bacterium OttesenSCG-928-I06]
MFNYRSGTLFHKLHHCSNIIDRSLHILHHRKNRENSIHRGQGKLLYIILNNDGISQKEIVHLLDIRPSSVGELVSKLEQQGFVEKRANEEDKRVSNIFLTEAGRKVAEEAIQERENTSDELFSGLLPEEQEKLGELLDKLAASLKEKFSEEYSKRGQGHHHGPHGHHDDSGEHRGRHGRGGHHHGRHHGEDDSREARYRHSFGHANHHGERGDCRTCMASREPGDTACDFRCREN